jgi:hypothetical protein
MTTTFQLRQTPLHALLTSIEDYAEDWESVLTDEEYVKLCGACEGCARKTRRFHLVQSAPALRTTEAGD